MAGKENSNPYISIIMSVYNNERYMPIAVNSIKNQTFDNWELIIIDDGSTDHTPEVADRIAEDDHRVRVIHQENQWIYNSYNNGIAAANGKYVLIVNSDDTISPETLQKIHDIAEVDDADLVIFNCCYNNCDADQNITAADVYGHSNDLEKDFSYGTREQVRREWGSFLKGTLITHQCVYKTKIAQRFKIRNAPSGLTFYNIEIADEIHAAAGISYVAYNAFHYEDNDTMNASVKKYYGGEHLLYNEIYHNYKNLFLRWGTYSDRAVYLLAKKRLNYLTEELTAYLSDKCPLTMDQKLEKIFTDLSDGVCYDCARDIDCVEEYHSRILSGLRQMFIEERPSENSPYYFMYKFLDSILRYEKDDRDMENIRSAVYHVLNPQRIGETFYKKLIGT